MNNTSYWICDKCGKKIESAKDGWVEWLIPIKNNVPETHNKGIRIVHATNCIYTDRECDTEDAIPGDDSLARGRGAREAPGTEHPSGQNLHHRGAGSDRRELHRRASAEICACPGAVGGVHTGLSRDMGHDTVEKTAVTAA